MITEFLGKPLAYWIEIRAVLEIFCIDSPRELEELLGNYYETDASLDFRIERLIFEESAKQLGGKP